jgi:outer membrane protein assembly factor BamB
MLQRNYGLGHLMIVSMVVFMLLVLSFAPFLTYVRATSAYSTSDPITLISPNEQSSGEFGNSVAISGAIAVVGAPDESASGLSGAGQAYVFNAKSGTLIRTLTSPNAQQNGAFGASVAISGTTIVVGAVGETVSASYSNGGRVYVFNATTGNLISTFSNPKPQSVHAFGYSLGVSGSIVVVGAYFSGHAYVFKASTGSIIKTLSSPSGDSSFGSSVAIEGSTIIIGSQDENVGGIFEAGRAYTFSAKTGALLRALISPNAQPYGLFGASVAISDSIIVVGAWGESVSGMGSAGHAYSFTPNRFCTSHVH